MYKINLTWACYKHGEYQAFGDNPIHRTLFKVIKWGNRQWESYICNDVTGKPLFTLGTSTNCIDAKALCQAKHEISLKTY